MLVKDLKKNNDYEFECSMSEEYKTYENHDEFGCAFVWLGSDIGVEYNFAVDEGENLSAIYKMEFNNETYYMETDYDKYVHYEVDFNNKKWRDELESAMCEALIKLHNL